MKPTLVPEKLLPCTLLAGLLHALKTLYPPSLMVHVGAGRGQGDLHTWQSWGLENVWLIDADDKRLAWANDRASTDEWRVIASTLAGQAALANYHLASSPDEDSLVPPEQLRRLWPNLRSRHTEARQTQTLDQVMSDALGDWAEDSPLGWLMVDCLPALELLMGSVQTLTRMQLVCVRVAQLGLTSDDDGLDQAAVTRYLAPLGFVPIAHVQGNHPDVGHAIYTRDFAQERLKLIADNATLATALDELTIQRAIEAQAKFEALMQCDLEVQAKAEAQAQRDIEVKAKIQARSYRDELVKEKLALTAALDEHATRVTELQDTLASLQSQHDRVANDKLKLAAENQELTSIRAQLSIQRNREAQDKLDALAQRDALAEEKSALTAARDEQAQLAADRQTALAAIQAQRDELAEEKTNLIAVNTELTSARAQLNAQRDAEANAKSEAYAQRDALAQEKLAMTAAHDEQAQLAADRQTALVAIQAQHNELVQEKANLIAANAELISARAQLNAQRDAEANAKSEAYAQRDALAQEKSALTASRDEQAQLAADRQTALAALQAQRDEWAQEKTNLIAVNAELTSARAQLNTQLDAEAKAKSDAYIQRDALVKEKASLMAAQDELGQLASEQEQSLMVKQQDTTTLQQRNQQLEARHHDNVIRQQLQHEELIKAEAQIELIKDLLLREPGL